MSIYSVKLKYAFKVDSLLVLQWAVVSIILKKRGKDMTNGEFNKKKFKSNICSCAK